MEFQNLRKEQPESIQLSVQYLLYSSFKLQLLRERLKRKKVNGMWNT